MARLPITDDLLNRIYIHLEHTMIDRRKPILSIETKNFIENHNIRPFIFFHKSSTMYSLDCVPYGELRDIDLKIDYLVFPHKGDELIFLLAI